MKLFRYRRPSLNMTGKGKQTARKPATKFAHLRKKMEKNRIVAKVGKKRPQGKP